MSTPIDTQALSDALTRIGDSAVTLARITRDLEETRHIGALPALDRLKAAHQELQIAMRMLAPLINRGNT